MTKKQSGFTLIELMIVVLVIAVLAAIGLPMYSEQVRKGKRTEAITVIGDMQLRQERWRSNNATYGNLTAATAALGNIFGSVASVTSYNAGLNNYTVSVTNNTATSYTVTATRKNSMTADTRCGNFVMTYSAGIATPSVSAGAGSDLVDYCWKRK